MAYYLANMTTSSKPNNTAIGSSLYYLAALDRASLLADLDRSVLILGERGSGKELVAHRMHFLSSRWGEPFIKLNCAALTETLVESTLFGHEAGAFTGATRSQPGYFERVGQGTLFLDEIATLSLRVQEKLLRVLEYGEFERLGGQKTLETQGRILAATHSDLIDLAHRGEFRHDLLDRLAFDVIHVPPLRQRGEDVLELAEHFAVGFAKTLGWEFFPGFSGSALQALQSYHWPGNVRELKNAVERSLFRAGQGDKPLQELVIDPFVIPWRDSSQAELQNVDREQAPSHIGQQSAPKFGTEPYDFKQARENWERQRIVEALIICQQHQGRAASHLGLSYDQLRALIKKLEIVVGKSL